MLKMSDMIGSHMVLQRDRENVIWGETKCGCMVTVIVRESADESREGMFERSVCADEKGTFEVVIPAMAAGGPYEIVIHDGTDEIILDDILFGDVFVLGGQSNMELPLGWIWDHVREELEKEENIRIRMIDLPKVYDFEREQDFITGAKWVSAKGEDLKAFSAVGYYAAREISERYEIPVGLIQTAVGGTPVKSWMSMETVHRLGYDSADLAECRDRAKIEAVMESELKREADWVQRAKDDFEKVSANVLTQKMVVPGFFEDPKMKQFCGSLCMKKTIVIDEADEGAAGKIVFGAVYDADTIYVNGVCVGETTFRYPPRFYELPSGVLKAGENEISVCMLVYRQNGGFMTGKGKEYKLVTENGTGYSLEGEWEYEIIREMEILPDMTFYQWKASGCYNSMICPLRKSTVKGVLFYQGESNCGRASTYEEEFGAMIGDWRKLWKDEQLGIVYVQLAGFSDGVLNTTATEWAQLRDAQLASEKINHAKMVQAYDLGEYNDLHPANKWDVGHRVALAAFELFYGEDFYEKGPQIESVVCEDAAAQVRFATKYALCQDKKMHDRNMGLEAGNMKKNEIIGFSWITKDATEKAVVATIAQDNTVLVPMPEGARELRYAWNDCPVANLYSSEGMPAVPFCHIVK